MTDIILRIFIAAGLTLVNIKEETNLKVQTSTIKKYRKSNPAGQSRNPDIFRGDGMNILFEPLATLVLTHDFFPNHQSGEPLFSIIPTQACKTALQKYGLLFRTTLTGGVVYYEYKEVPVSGSFTHKPVRPFPETLHLSFMLQPLMKNFYNRTEIPLDNDDTHIYRFSNLANNVVDSRLCLNSQSGSPVVTGADNTRLKPQIFTAEIVSTKPFVLFDISSDPGAASLLSYQVMVKRENTGDTAGTASKHIDLSTFDPGMFLLDRDGIVSVFYASSELYQNRPFGVLDIYIHPKVPAAYRFIDSQGNAAPKTYHLGFANREVWWRYVAVLKDRPSLSPYDVSITSIDPAVNFSGPVPGTMSDGTKILSFISSTKIPLQHQSETGISFVKSGSQSFSLDNLANPETGRLIPHETIENDYYAESYIYV